ncbi:hypothetical protein L0663_17465 [Dyadobacter sp. CY107]|uniref:hypothetical protein n=1 Tax=Dyadobacter fanqingshengii TaxID=2906443 RepID=UPI001F333F7C|nr:hypothetical protein [Dyadobacter fanqingshengii]MCF2505188.1 hypothetical protein [Dyadobacter fanqingshengii]
MSLTLLNAAHCVQLSVLALIISSTSIQAGRFEIDTIADLRKTKIATDSIPKTVFEPSVANGKDAAAGSVMFGVIAICLNGVSIFTKSLGPSGFAFIGSLVGLTLAGISARLSRKRKSKIPFSSLEEYKAVRKTARNGAILAIVGHVIAMICMAAFFTLTIAL